MRASVTNRALQEAEKYPEKHNKSGRYLMLALLAFILLSAGYNINWLRSEGVPQIGHSISLNKDSPVNNINNPLNNINNPRI